MNEVHTHGMRYFLAQIFTVHVKQKDISISIGGENMSKTKIGMALGVLLIAVGIGSYMAYAIPDTEAQVVKGSGTVAVQQGKKPLIVYFTYSENIGDTSGMDVDAITSASLHGEKIIKEGNMQVMVKEIQQRTGADVYPIVVQEPYAPNFDDMTNKAKADIEQEKIMPLKGTLPDLSAYDVIYFGTPIWWYILSAPVSTFLKQTDFSGKTIVPFGIHRGSGWNKNLDTIQDLQPGAKMANGFTIDARTPNEETRTQFQNFLTDLGI